MDRFLEYIARRKQQAITADQQINGDVIDEFEVRADDVAENCSCVFRTSAIHGGRI